MKSEATPKFWLWLQPKTVGFGSGPKKVDFGFNLKKSALVLVKNSWLWCQPKTADFGSSPKTVGFGSNPKQPALAL